MADGIGFKIIGARQLEDNLNALGPRLKKATIERALLRVSQPIVSAAKAGAPSDGDAKGWTKNRISASPKLSKSQRRQAGREPKTRTTVYIGVSPSPVAHLIEFGTGPRWTSGKAKNKRTKGARSGPHTAAYRGIMPPAPFMRPAWDSGKYGALGDLGVILGEEIEKTAARLGRRKARG